MLSSCCLSLVCVCRFVLAFVVVGDGNGLPFLVSFNFFISPFYLDVLFSSFVLVSPLPFVIISEL